MNFFGDGILILSLGVEATSGSACGLLGPPCSDILSESLLLSELLGSFPEAAAGALDVDPCGGDCGNPPGATVDALASSFADSDSTCCALSLASCLAASSIENCSVTGALMNRPCSSLARFLVPFLGGLLPLGSWGSSILITC